MTEYISQDKIDMTDYINISSQRLISMDGNSGSVSEKGLD
jgi:hypothetical protein